MLQAGHFLLEGKVTLIVTADGDLTADDSASVEVSASVDVFSSVDDGNDVDDFVLDSFERFTHLPNI